MQSERPQSEWLYKGTVGTFTIYPLSLNIL
jgi:hypothetical protein